MRSSVSIDNYTKSWKENVNCALQDAQYLNAVPSYVPPTTQYSVAAGSSKPYDVSNRGQNTCYRAWDIRLCSKYDLLCNRN